MYLKISDRRLIIIYIVNIIFLKIVFNELSSSSHIVLKPGIISVFKSAVQAGYTLGLGIKSPKSVDGRVGHLMPFEGAAFPLTPKHLYTMDSSYFFLAQLTRIANNIENYLVSP